jgi:hypothetical protein
MLEQFDAKSPSRTRESGEVETQRRLSKEANAEYATFCFAKEAIPVLLGCVPARHYTRSLRSRGYRHRDVRRFSFSWLFKVLLVPFRARLMVKVTGIRFTTASQALRVVRHINALTYAAILDEADCNGVELR